MIKLSKLPDVLGYVILVSIVGLEVIGLAFVVVIAYLFGLQVHPWFGLLLASGAAAVFIGAIIWGARLAAEVGEQVNQNSRSQ